MKETHYYLVPSCGSVPESLRHWYIDDYSRDEVACIARGIVIGLRAAGRKSARVDIYSVDDAGNKTYCELINLCPAWVMPAPGIFLQ